MTDWMPIDTAPKDKLIMLWFPAIRGWLDRPWFGNWSWVKEEWVISTPLMLDEKAVSVNEIGVEPTHWAPSPLRPNARIQPQSGPQENVND